MLTIQADFGAVKIVTGVTTQGRQDADEWVDAFFVSYSTNDVVWTFVRDVVSGIKLLFRGNVDRDTLVESQLPEPVLARYVRLHPLTSHGAVSLRWDVRGCNNGKYIAICGVCCKCAVPVKIFSFS